MAAPVENWTAVLMRLGYVDKHAWVQRLLGYTVTVAGEQYTLRARTAEPGSYGVVYAAQTAAGTWFAVKVFLKPACPGTAVELGNAERFLSGGLKPHRNLLSLYAHSDRAPAAPPAGSQLPPLTLPCIVCELCALLHNNEFQHAFSLHCLVYMTPLDERFARHFFSEILHGLRYLHSMGICHRDLKTENIFFSRDGILKVGDFGAAKHALLHADGGDGAQLYQTSTVDGVGSDGYRPPEYASVKQSKGATYGARAVDVFAMGMVLLYLVGVDEFLVPSFKEEPNMLAPRRVVMPFANENFKLLADDAPAEYGGRLYEAAPRFETFWGNPDNQALSKRLSPDCKDLINRCMVKNPLQRISLDDIANHPFLLREPQTLGKRPHGAGAPLPPYPNAEEVSHELERRMLRVTAHPNVAAHPALVACSSAGAIGIGTLQRASSVMFHGAPQLDGVPQLDDVWNVRLDIPTDRMFVASTHLILVGEETVGQRTLYAAEAFTTLSGMLDHIPGAAQQTRGDPDSGLSLRLTGVYKPPCDADDDTIDDDDDGVEARFSAQVMLQPLLQDGAASHRLVVLLQLLPLNHDRYNDSNEKLAARGKAIEALATEIRAGFATKRVMNLDPAGAAGAR